MEELCDYCLSLPEATEKMPFEGFFHNHESLLTFNICPGLTDKVLNNRLKDLIENKMIEKRGSEYIMTEHGISPYRVIQELWRWGCRHRHVMLGEPVGDDLYSEQLI